MSKVRILPVFGRLSYCKNSNLEMALYNSFDSQSRLYGVSQPKGSTAIRVAVVSREVNGKKPVVISNYNTEGRRDSCKSPPLSMVL